MKVFLDDIRNAPSSDWVICRSASTCLALLETGAVKEISFDHDLGEEDNLTGYDVAKNILLWAFNSVIPPLRWHVHSANPVGADNIKSVMRKADYFWDCQGTDASKADVSKAAEFAKKAHQGQYRKHFVNRPYFHHVAYVAGRVALWGTKEEVSAAYLHDTLEDTSTTLLQLETLFGKPVASLVLELTQYSKQINSTAPRRERKKMDCEYLSKASLSAKRIKLVDRACNLEDYLSCPITSFTLKYVDETEALLQALAGADEEEETYIRELMAQIRSQEVS